MSSSDVIAIVSIASSFFMSALALFVSFRQYRLQAKPPTKFDVQVVPVIDEDSINASVFGSPIIPSYIGTFTVEQGRLTLGDCGFYIKRKSENGEIMVHACPGKFDHEREKPVLSAGEEVIAVPADKRRLRELLAGAISIRFECQTLSGKIYRSSDMKIYVGASSNLAAQA